jgi:hypothetical protein
MTGSGRKASAVAAVLVLTTITQVSLLSLSSARGEPGAGPSPVAPFPAPPGPARSSPALPMPEADTLPGLPIPQLLLGWPWLSRVSPSESPSTASPAGVGGPFTSRCTACSSRQMPLVAIP